MNKVVKRGFDIFAACFGLLFLGWVILLTWGISSFETKSNGFFFQTRVGRAGKQFKIVKIKTMHERMDGENRTDVTTSNMSEITRSGRILRKYKLDELPQLLNVLLGNMSLVGPRPDVPGFADELEGEDRIILSIRPGITSPASLAFRNEEEILANVDDPETYNREIIWPAKVAMNREYAENYSLRGDANIIWETVFG